MKNQENWGCNSIWVQRPENWWCKFWSKSKVWEPGALMFKDRKRWMSQLRKREFELPFLCLLFYLGPEWVGWCPLILGRAIHFTQFTDSNPNLSETSLQTPPEIMLYQLFGHPLAQLSWHLKLTVTSVMTWLHINSPNIKRLTRKGKW